MGAIETEVGLIGVAQGGGGELIPIVFLHGVGSDKSVWHPQMDAFRGRRTIAVDYPGYGESAAVRDATRDDYARCALTAMDALGIERAHVCGLSLGGVVAITMAAMASERCASLILADTFAVHPDGEAIYRRSVDAAKSIGMSALAEARAGALLATSTPPTVRTEVVETMSRIDPEAYIQGANAVWLADQRDRASAIRRPTLILVGDEDHVTPPSLSEVLAGLIPGSKMEVIAGAGHLGNLEKPDAFNRAVERFVSENDAD